MARRFKANGFCRSLAFLMSPIGVTVGRIQQEVEIAHYQRFSVFLLLGECRRRSKLSQKSTGSANINVRTHKSTVALSTTTLSASCNTLTSISPCRIVTPLHRQEYHRVMFEFDPLLAKNTCSRKRTAVSLVPMLVPPTKNDEQRWRPQILMSGTKPMTISPLFTV
jgi:hypothetical protein